MTSGNRPADGGNLIIEEKDYDTFIKSEPKALPYIKRLSGATEFINNKNGGVFGWLAFHPQHFHKCLW